MLASGCGATCPQIQQSRRDFFARKHPHPAVHASVDVPFELVNALFAEQLRGMPPVPVTIPGLGRYQAALGAVAIAPRAVRLKGGQPGQVHFDLDLNVLHRGRVLFTMATTAAVAPQIKGRALLIPLGPTSLRQVRPTLPPAAARSLAKAIRARLPAAARTLLPNRVLQQVANTALAELVNGGYALLRDSVLAEMAPLTQLTLDLPDLPIEGVRLRSHATWLSVGLKTRLPVEGVLPAAATPPARQRMRVRLLGGTVAALGNQAIARGALPRRLNAKGKPTPDGEFRPGLDWQSGDRPAKIWLWREQDTCMRAQIGGTPTLSARLNAKREHVVHVAVQDGTVEDVDGPMLLTMGAWIQQLWTDAITISQAVVAQIRLELGQRVLDVAVQRAQVKADVVEIELSARHR